MTDSQNPPRRQACEEARLAAEELLLEVVIERTARSSQITSLLETRGACSAGRALDDEIPF